MYFPELNLPKIQYEYEENNLIPIDNNTIENYAKMVRDYWNMGDKPIDNLISIIQKNGIMVSKIKLRLKKIDAFSVWFNNRPFIFLNSDKDTNSRIRFDIAHELAHILMYSDFYSEEDLKCNKILEKVEDEANRFASAFIMPKVTFSKDVFSTSIDHFIQMKSKWKVSIGSMIYRFESLDILSQNQIKYLKHQMTLKVY